MALETLAVKAFGDMGPNARLQLIRDRFVAGHENCALQRHLDSVAPETPIRDIVDRCSVWESHADTGVRRPLPPPRPITTDLELLLKCLLSGVSAQMPIPGPPDGDYGIRDFDAALTTGGASPG